MKGNTFNSHIPFLFQLQEKALVMHALIIHLLQIYVFIFQIMVLMIVYTQPFLQAICFFSSIKGD